MPSQIKTGTMTRISLQVLALAGTIIELVCAHLSFQPTSPSRWRGYRRITDGLFSPSCTLLNHLCSDEDQYQAEAAQPPVNARKTYIDPWIISVGASEVPPPKTGKDGTLMEGGNPWQHKEEQEQRERPSTPPQAHALVLNPHMSAWPTCCAFRKKLLNISLDPSKGSWRTVKD